MDRFTDLFPYLLTPEMRTEAEADHSHNTSSQNLHLRIIERDSMLPPGFNIIPDKFDTSDPRILSDMIKSVVENVKSPFPPLETLPCANVEPDKFRACSKPGTMACSACKLVSYCSRECQKARWSAHKQDCKSLLRSENWYPAWMLEGRVPVFVRDESAEQEFERKIKDKFSIGLSLWGNMPAMDVINLSNNENDVTSDFSLAFIASGDLRHVVHTINALPSNYSGNLKVLINDRTLPIVCRNIILLLIFGTISDEVLAADIALHFWYSAFIPAEHHVRISAIISSLLQDIGNGVASFLSLGPRSTLSFAVPEHAVMYIAHYAMPSFSLREIQDEYARVRNAPSRQDYRDRMYAKLKPSHRVAFQEYRRSGLVLPFGAMNTHFNTPNTSLFSPRGEWLQTDYADPLDGWNLDEIIKAGKAHGARPEDIYGCLYFFLSDEFRSFFRRLRQFPIAFSLYNLDTTDLSQAIRDSDSLSEHGIPSTIRFDRIEVSNILDSNYVGLRGVLENWAPLLKEGGTAAIVGYFMNWEVFQEDGSAEGAGRKVLNALLPRYVDKLKSHRHKPDMRNLGTMAADIDAFYENYIPFTKFLKKQGLDDVLGRTRLKLRQKHTIIPHRLRTPLHGHPTSLPSFPDEDTWYYWNQIYSCTWLERFVEFSHI